MDNMMQFKDGTLDEMILNDYKHFNTIYIAEEIGLECQVRICRQLRKLAEQELKKEKEDRKHIKIRLTTCGGAVVSLFAIVSYMEYYKNKGIIIETYCDGYCASAGAKILMCGSKGYRYSTKRACILIHQTQATLMGHYTLQESKATVSNMVKDWEIAKDIFRENSNLTEEEIENLTEKNLDVIYTAQESLEKGIVDHLIG